MSRIVKSLLLGAVVLSLAPLALAGTIVTTFSSPVFNGSIVNVPGVGQTTYADDTGTAVYTINNGPTVSSVRWGSFAAGETTQEYSELTLTGSSIPSDVSTPFQLGTLTFTNGTSDLGTVIFGVTLNFYDTTVSTESFLGSDQVIITTTSNAFGVPGGLTSGDDDYVNICGNQSNICTTSIEAVEASQGGSGVTVNLFGRIVGDPMADIDFAELAPGQDPLTNGFLGNDPAVGGQVPEPGSLTLILTGASVGIGLWRRRRSA